MTDGTYINNDYTDAIASNSKHWTGRQHRNHRKTKKLVSE